MELPAQSYNPVAIAFASSRSVMVKRAYRVRCFRRSKSGRRLSGPRKRRRGHGVCRAGSLHRGAVRRIDIRGWRIAHLHEPLRRPSGGDRIADSHRRDRLSTSNVMFRLSLLLSRLTTAIASFFALRSSIVQLSLQSLGTEPMRTRRRFGPEPPNQPRDPNGGVREPKWRAPTGRSAAVAMSEPDEAEQVVATAGRHRDYSGLDRTRR